MCVDPLTIAFLAAGAIAVVYFAVSASDNTAGVKRLSKAEIKVSRKADLRLQAEEIEQNASFGITDLAA